MTFFPRLAGTFEVVRDGEGEKRGGGVEGAFFEGTEVRKKARGRSC